MAILVGLLRTNTRTRERKVSRRGVERGVRDYSNSMPFGDVVSGRSVGSRAVRTHAVVRRVHVGATLHQLVDDVFAVPVNHRPMEGGHALLRWAREFDPSQGGRG